MKASDLQNKIIEMLRVFSRNNYHDFSTSFQRMYAKELIEVVLKGENPAPFCSICDCYKSDKHCHHEE